jgi:hypothetical protein
VVTDVLITLGGASIFSFDGTTATAGPADGVSTNLVALDDVILAEPAPQDANISATAGAQLSGPVAQFVDTDPNGNARDYQANIEWGDGTSSPGSVTADATGGFTVSGSHAFAQSGVDRVVVTVSDFGGEGHSSHFLALVSARSTATSVSCAPGTVLVGHGTTCTATVSDTAAGPASAPTGTVAFATGTGLGGFNAGGCTLAALGAGRSICAVSYVPDASGSRNPTITASFAGDSAHTGSTGSTTVATRAPGCTLGTLRSKARGGRLTVRISCDQLSTVVISGTLTLARKGSHPRQRLTLAPRTLAVGRSRTVRLGLPRLAVLRAAAKRHQRISLTLKITATSFATSTATATVRSLRLS